MADVFNVYESEVIIPHSQRGKDSMILMEMIKAAISARGNETTKYTYERLKSGEFPLGEHEITIRWSDE
ncbi:hypothetical protein M4L38_00980 [Staphylococcus equorum]|uniref:hypothetical protein n=1 Tax=Staphylococcus equorum TaxID=246432 RepID=UPI002407CEE4|nr:hypothetical protein [Staphylococcus equorum]MDG0821339.1 hypothetical protein [Staphylococcus equorum]